MRNLVLSQNIDFAAEGFFNVLEETTDDYSGKGGWLPAPIPVPGQFGIRIAERFGASPNSQHILFIDQLLSRVKWTCWT